jgi:hypothetical protein
MAAAVALRADFTATRMQHLDFGPDAAATLSTAKRTMTPGDKIRKRI